MELILNIAIGIIIGVLVGWLIAKAKTTSAIQVEKDIAQQKFGELEKELVGESAYYDIRRSANDFVSRQILEELKEIGQKQ